MADEAQALFDQPFAVVIANAGGGMAARLADISLEQQRQTLAVNLTGTFLTFREALKGMAPGGRVIRRSGGRKSGRNLLPEISSARLR